VVTAIGIPSALRNSVGNLAAAALAPTLLQLDFSRLAEQTFIIVVFSFLMVDVFDMPAP